MEWILPAIGFVIAAYAVIANDVIQTLGTFLSSNRERRWWILWLYAATILTAALLTGWYFYNGDVSYGRLSSIGFPDEFRWWLILPPVVLLIITRFGMPVSTTFMILSAFSTSQVIEKMIIKSVVAYMATFSLSFIVYLIISRRIEMRFIKSSLSGEENKSHPWWIAGQWVTTGFLWWQWLIQDFANIYVYLPRQLDFPVLLISLFVLLVLLAVLMKIRGGRIQKIVTSKTNTSDIRSATIIDAVYGLGLFVFTVVNPIPMSTTWAFIGILGGREFAINYVRKRKIRKKTARMIQADLGKVFAGFLISIFLVYLIRLLDLL